MKLFVVFFILGGLLLAQAPSPTPAPPAITREQLQARLEDLQHGKEQAIANVNAFVGAIQETQHWLDELKAAEAKPAAAKPGPPAK